MDQRDDGLPGRPGNYFSGQLCLVGWFALLLLIRSTPPELLHQLKDAGASVVFVDPTLLHNVHSALKLDGAPNIPTDRIILLCQAANRPPALADYKCIEEIWSDPTEMVPLKEGEEHETTSLLYSSGTTGRAKGVETTHYNFTSQLQALNASMEPLNPAKDVAIGFLPFGHAYLFSTGIVRIRRARSLTPVAKSLHRRANGGATSVLRVGNAQSDPEI